ncbi:hypothetical protein BDZ85DRAFT_126291 [Elsinoe ampelina]|uniref:Uncharacterized protein n=1 Tax=Elsinoe ampelina TaxID=302913 RepID=A0A6A6GAB3_9PEZI|nr:hypothetical protein BDZ85DRAFT_126291 [Elsinoe ampelina]
MATDQNVHDEEGQTIGFCNYFDRGQPERLTVREVAMIRRMNEITDETGWHLKIFDDEHLQRWRSECDPMMNVHAWSWIITELRAKAREHDDSHPVLAFDVGYRVCKSDDVFDDSIAQNLRDYAYRTNGRRLQADDLVTHSLNPWLNPFIYDYTDILTHGEVVDLLDPMSSTGKGSPLLSPILDGASRSAYDGYSALSQLLPFEITFGQVSDERVRIVSYINDGDKILGSECYKAMEDIIAKAIQAWNLVLVRRTGPPDHAEGRERTPLRIRTYGFTTVPHWPLFATRLPFITGPEDSRWKEALDWTQAYVEQPDHPSRNPDLYCDWREEFEDLSDCHSGVDLLRSMSIKWKGMQHIEHPNPGVSFTYYDWLAGRTGKAIHSKTKYWHEEEAGPDDDDHEYYDVDLRSGGSPDHCSCNKYRPRLFESKVRRDRLAS